MLRAIAPSRPVGRYLRTEAPKRGSTFRFRLAFDGRAWRIRGMAVIDVLKDGSITDVAARLRSADVTCSRLAWFDLAASCAAAGPVSCPSACTSR